MNILFIGGAGFIGSSLVKRFISDEKHSVFILEPEFADISRLKDYNLTVFRSSLSNINEVKNILLTNKIEVVVHLVSTLIPGSTYDDYIGEFKNVIFPSIELMEFCANEDIKFVYFSSGGTIYGNRTTFQPFVETDSMEPISYYGWSKQMMENSILFKNRTQKLKFLIVRPSNPYGHGQNLYGKQGLVAVAIGKIIENKPVEVWGDGSAIRDYIYIEDLANIFYQLINKDVCNETINLGSGRGFSVNDVLALKEADCSIAMAAGSDAAKNIANVVLLDSNFGAMPHIVNQGRRVVNNIRSAASMFLIKTIFSVLLSLITIFFGDAYPFEPIQMSLISACAVGIPTFLLTQENNYNKIDHTFLRHVFMNAFPAAVTITGCVFTIMLVCQDVYHSNVMLNTACVLVTGWNYMSALRTVYSPLNTYRKVIIYGMQFAFFISAVVLQDLLTLGSLEFGMIILVFVLMTFSPILIETITEWIRRIYEKSLDREDENKGLQWFDFEEALKASTEPWLVENVYKKLNKKIEKGYH